MKFKELFPSARLLERILFVQVADLLGGRGYLDAQNLEQFQRGLRVLRKTDYANCAVGLSFRDVSYVSSHAIEEILDFQQKLQATGRRLLLYELPPKMKIVLGELGLDGVLDIYGLQGHVLKFFSPNGQTPGGAAGR